MSEQGRPRFGVRQPGGNTMHPNAPLRVIELNVSPATKYPRTPIPADALARLKPVSATSFLIGCPCPSGAVSCAGLASIPMGSLTETGTEGLGESGVQA